MKKIFAILMSFQLILSPVAFAQNIPGTEDAIKNDAYKETGTGSSGGYDFYISQIAGIGTGMLGASILTQCIEGLKNPSIATFMAGSLVHIASEILGAKSKNERSRKKFDDLKLKQEDLAKTGDASDLEFLKTNLQEEEDTRDFLRNRKNWMIAVDVIYVAAVGLALLEEFYGIGGRTGTALTSCTALATGLATTSCTAAAAAAGPSLGTLSVATGVAAVAAGYVTGATAGSTVIATAAASAATAAAGTVYGLVAMQEAALIAGELAVPACITAFTGAEIPLCKTNSAVVTEGVKASVVSHAAAREALKTSCAGPYYAGCYAAGEAEFALVYAACSQVPRDGGTSMFSWPKLLTMAYGFGSAKLTEGGGQVSQYGSMAVTLLTAFVPGVSKFVAQAYNFPIPRSITFGALAVMSGVNTVGLAAREEISEGNIGKLRLGIDQFKIESEGSAAGVGLDAAPADSGNGPKTPGKKPVLKKLVVLKPKQCISNSTGSFDISENACKKPIKFSKASFSNINVPVLNNVANLATDMAQALANGDEAKAAGLAGEIGGLASRVKQATEELKTKYNENQKKNKRAPLDFKKSIAQQVASIQGTLNEAAASKNINLAAMASGSAPASEKPKNDQPLKKNDVVALPVAEPVVDFGTTEEPEVEATAAASEDQSLDDFESSEQDVSKKSEVSIFKQLSNRYILNYTKIFDRKKEPVVVPEEPKKN
jgi:hypothetical protein